jgi:hypothetical protein
MSLNSRQRSQPRKLEEPLPAPRVASDYLASILDEVYGLTLRSDAKLVYLTTGGRGTVEKFGRQGLPRIGTSRTSFRAS